MAKIGTNPSFAGLKTNPSWIRKALKKIEFKCTNTKVCMKVNIPNKIKTTTDYLTLRKSLSSERDLDNSPGILHRKCVLGATGFPSPSRTLCNSLPSQGLCKGGALRLKQH